MDQSPVTQEEPSTLKSYVLGFVLSVLLTLASHFAVANHLLPPTALLCTILGLALIQAYVQLVLFLHLGKEKKPQWKLVTFLFMLSVLIILVLGSIWIMDHLAYNVMPTM